MPELLSQKKDDVLVVQFTSPKILDDTLISAIKGELSELADQTDGKMVLDFQGVTFMSSSMIGNVVALNNKCKANDIALRMCNLSPDALEVLVITHLDTVFRICSTVDEAIRDF